MPYLKITIETESEQQCEMLLASLSLLPFNGYEQEDRQLIAYMESSLLDINTLENILKQIDVKYSISNIENENWNKVWESNFEPVSVMKADGSGVFAYIRAAFHLPLQQAAEYEIVITPKMSFGTGHHATTYQMVEHMSDMDFSGKSVIDFGSGTGVLAILAEKMGAEDVFAIECEDWTVENAIENAKVNLCERVEVVRSEQCFFKNKPVDIVLANINLNVIIEHLIEIKKSVKQGGKIIFSGFLNTDEQQISSRLYDNGFDIEKVTSRDTWLAITAKSL